MRKTSGNVFLGHLGECVFHIFPRLHSIMTWILYLTLKCIDEFRLGQLNILSTIYMFEVSKINNNCEKHYPMGWDGLAKFVALYVFIFIHPA